MLFYGTMHEGLGLENWLGEARTSEPDRPSLGSSGYHLRDVLSCPVPAEPQDAQDTLLAEQSLISVAVCPETENQSSSHVLPLMTLRLRCFGCVMGTRGRPIANGYEGLCCQSMTKLRFSHWPVVR